MLSMLVKVEVGCKVDLERETDEGIKFVLSLLNGPAVSPKDDGKDGRESGEREGEVHHGGTSMRA
jgi:hypothetical protein